MVKEGELLWTPRPEFAASSNLAHYMGWLKQNRKLEFKDYESLRRWSVTDIEAFWATIWDYFKVQSEQPYLRVVDQRVMPGAKWFEGSRLNYTEHLLRAEATKGEAPVFHHLSENRALARMSWNELGRQVRILATQLRALGVMPGDRVVSYMCGPRRRRSSASRP
jgi:acetoacetyl-CoA synthetase